MKKLLAAMFVALLMVGCGGENEPTLGEIWENRGFLRSDGLHTSYYENGQKKWDRNYKDGEPDGLSISWKENGQKSSEINFKDGKWDGLATRWWLNGQKRMKKNFKNGLLVTGIAWKPNGEKCPQTNVVDGNGVVVEYNEDGTENGKGGWDLYLGDPSSPTPIHLRQLSTSRHDLGGTYTPSVPGRTK